MISFKAQSLGSIGKVSILSGYGTLIPYPDQVIPAGEIVLVTVDDGGPLTASMSNLQPGDTSRLLLLEDGDFRIAFVVPVTATISAKASISITTVAQESFEGLELPKLSNAPIDPITPPPQILELPFELEQ